jgi:hypothetical protein
VSSYKINNFGFSMQSEVAVGNALATGKTKPAVEMALSFMPGSTAGLVDRFYAEPFDLAGSASVTFDFNAGPLLGPDQAAVATWARILAWAVVLDPLPAGASGIVIGGDAAPVPLFDTPATVKTLFNSTTGTWFGGGGGEPGVLVTAATGDKVKLLNSDAVKHATGKVCFIGRSA